MGKRRPTCLFTCLKCGNPTNLTRAAVQELAAQREAEQQRRASKVFMLSPRTPSQRCTQPKPFLLRTAAKEVSCAVH